MDKQYKMKAAINKTFLEPIGLVTVNFAMLEGHIPFFIWQLIGKEQRVGQIITAELSFKQLVGLFASLFRLRVTKPEHLNEFEKIRKSLYNVEERRNTIIHSQWATGDTHELSTRFKIKATSKKGLQHIFEKVAVADVQKLADDLAKLSYDIEQLMIKIFIPVSKEVKHA